MKDLRPARPDLLTWAMAWIVVTVMFWSVARMTGSPNSWYASALLAGIIVVAGELIDRHKQKRRTRKRSS
ncbi:hypothetical protein [Streptomyces sp. 142MFCol3.1]|uniref:hypothetical protein n=1 Tax=Streptomyces sp. 142MFCol3.1 TaxID=1172179 RepID=UPI000418BB91|nr:hypothetical protein [Streptomyces sp. 142MFCol3.1]